MIINTDLPDKKEMVESLVKRHIAVTPPNRILELHAQTVFTAMMNAPDEDITRLFLELQDAPPIHYDA